MKVRNPSPKKLFASALDRAKSTGDTLGDTAFTMKDAHLYLAQIALKSGDVQAWTLAFRHKRRLIMSNDAAIRDAAER